MKKRRFMNAGDRIIKRMLCLSCIGVVALAIAGCLLTVQSSYADTSVSKTSSLTISVGNACTMTGGSNGTSTSGAYSYSATVPANTSREINGSKFVTVCNDAAGYSLYAIGYSDNSYGNTSLISTVGSIATNTNTSGSTSGWAMQVGRVTGDAPEIMNNFDSYRTVPDTYVQVARYTGTTATSEDAGAQVQAKYRVFVSSSQPAGVYNGKVKYTMIHPNNAAAPGIPVPLSDATYMQDAIDCPNTQVGTTKTLTDSRDQQTYIVGKAADGNCWMLQNLKLGKTTESLTLTPTTSNVYNNFTLTNKLTNGRFHAYTIDGVAYQNNSSEYYCTDDYGCYYNWYTATAGSGSTGVASGSVDSSICPAGWTLPTQSQFSTLYSNYNSAALMLVDSPTTTKENTAGKIPGFLLSGLYSTGGADGLGSYGYYWSRAAGSAQSAYGLYLNSSSVNPAVNYGKYDGFSVRCILE